MPTKNYEEVPFWKDLMAHIDETWKKKKGVGFFFRPKYFRDIKEMVRLYTVFGVMALWDLYLSDNDDEFVRKCGYSFEMFLHKIPRLLDETQWKRLRNSYEMKLIGMYPKVVEELGEGFKEKAEDLSEK